MDWKIFEQAGKYAGLAGIALIVLLYIIRQILTLPIFDKIGGKGTQLTINNIINKVFWVTIAALVAWLLIGLFGKDAGRSGDLTGPVATFGAQTIQATDLPSGVTDPVSDDSTDEQAKELQQRSSLALNGTTLVIGAAGEGRTVTIGCNTLRMTNGARIITNGNRLVIVCLKTLFGDNSGIVSFPPGMPKAEPVRAVSAAEASGSPRSRVSAGPTSIVARAGRRRWSGRRSGEPWTDRRTWRGFRTRVSRLQSWRPRRKAGRTRHQGREWRRWRNRGRRRRIDT